MSAVDGTWMLPDRAGAVRGALWVTAAALALFAHAATIFVALRQTTVPAATVAAPAPITVDLAPMPAAPSAEEERDAPDLTDGPDVDADTPDALAEPAPPPPTVQAVAPDAPDTLPSPPLPAPPRLADALPEVQPAAEPPDPMPAEPRPVSRPDDPRLARAPASAPEPEPEPAAVERQRTRDSRPAARAQARAEPADAAPLRAASGDRGASPARWQARLMAHLERLKRYPTGAQRRREEGVVMVRFVIDEAGNVRSAAIARSSGYRDLDEAVLALLHRASPVPAPPAGAPRTVTAPVRFDVR